MLDALRRARGVETESRAKKMLDAIIENAREAKRSRIAICQDTGMPTVFLSVGQKARIGGNLIKAVNRGVERAYARGCFRKSVVADPVARGASGFSPAVIHIDIVPGARLTVQSLPKGFGCENKTKLFMLQPTVSRSEIRDAVLGAVKEAGGDACPPYVVGVGIGGTADYAALLAKKALLEPLDGASAKNSDSVMEKELLRAINCLGIGPMGLGGKTTALRVRILTFPTHIAGLPVAVSISCHALRSATVRI